MIKDSNKRLITTMEKSIINDFEIEAKRNNLTKSQLLEMILKNLGFGKSDKK